MKRYITALQANKSSKGRWDVVGSSILQGRQWGQLVPGEGAHWRDVQIKGKHEFKMERGYVKALMK